MLRFNVLDNKRVPCHRRIETDRLGGNKVLGLVLFLLMCSYKGTCRVKCHNCCLQLMGFIFKELYYQKPQDRLLMF